MSEHRAQFQLDNGNGWETIAEVDIIGGTVHPPNAWSMARALRKQIIYTGSVSEEITTVASYPRNTHFAGFANALARELTEMHVFYETTGVGQLTIARRAYDLALYVLGRTQMSEAFAEGLIRSIPDMTELPEEERP